MSTEVKIYILFGVLTVLFCVLLPLMMKRTRFKDASKGGVSAAAAVAAPADDAADGESESEFENEQPAAPRAASSRPGSKKRR